MLGKTITVLALAASLGAIGISPSLAGDMSTAGTGGWTNTNASAADSRANLAETVLTPAAVSKVKYLRSVTSPLIRPTAACPGPVLAPLLAGGYLYAITNDMLSKYDPATGKLLWRANPNPNGAFIVDYQSLAISGGLVITGGEGCESASDPGGFIVAFNASTGALVWTAKYVPSGLNQAVTVGTSYVVGEGVAAGGNDTAVLNLKNGTLLWHSYGCEVASPNDPVVVGMMVMRENGDSQCINNDIEALNIATGTVAWSLPGNWRLQRGDLAGSAGNHLYATDPSGTVEALNPQTGQVEYPLTSAVTVLAVDATRVYATCGGSYPVNVCAYSSSTGGLEWQSSIWAGDIKIAAEADGVLYLDSGHALNASTGQVIKRIWGDLSGYSATAPTAIAVGDGRIAITGDPRVLDLFGLNGS